jgi:hypothetical protein
VSDGISEDMKLNKALWEMAEVLRNGAVLEAADEAVRLEPGLRHPLGLAENELPSQIAYKLGSRVKADKLSGPAKQIVRPLVSFVLPLKRLHRRRERRDGN